MVGRRVQTYTYKHTLVLLACVHACAAESRGRHGRQARTDMHMHTLCCRGSCLYVPTPSRCLRPHTPPAFIHICACIPIQTCLHPHINLCLAASGQRRLPRRLRPHTHPSCIHTQMCMHPYTKRACIHVSTSACSSWRARYYLGAFGPIRLPPASTHNCACIHMQTCLHPHISLCLQPVANS